MSISSPMSTDPKEDILRGGPPVPGNLRSAKPRPAMPKPAGSSSSGIGHLLGGGSPIAGVMDDVMEIDKRIKSLAQIRPDIAQLFAQPLSQARDMMAGSLADLAQGGTGTPPQDVGAMPPGAGGPGAGAGAGPGGLMAPPPPPAGPM